MPNEPEREIEKTLRDYARHRREQAGAPRDPHPATRKLLRDEAARVHPPARAAGSRPVWPWFSWPRVAFGAGMLALLGVAVSIYLSKSPKQSGEMQFSMNRAMHVPQPATRAPSSVTAPAPAADFSAAKKIPRISKDESADKLKAGEPAASNRFSFSDAEKIAPKFPPSDTPVTQTGALDGVQPPARLTLDSRPASNQALAQALAPALTPPPFVSAPVASAPAPVALEDRMPAEVNSTAAPAAQTTAISGTASQRFYRVNATAGEFKAAKSLVQPDVLNSFRVEQSGDQVRFIDRDGSVYAGQLQNAAMRERSSQRSLAENLDLSGGAQKESLNERTNAKSDLQSRAAAAKPGSNGAPVYFFRVLGTNRSLNQPVVFTGEFLDAGASGAGSLGSASDVSGGTISDSGGFGGGAISTNLAPLQLLNFRVSGRAQIGTNKAADILANPAPAR